MTKRRIVTCYNNVRAASSSNFAQPLRFKPSQIPSSRVKAISLLSGSAYLCSPHSRYRVGPPSLRCCAWTSRASSAAPQSLQKKRTPCYSTFPKFVPSLSWQKDRSNIRMAQRRRFPHRRLQRGSQCHRIHRSLPGTACGCRSRGSNGCSRRSSTWQTNDKHDRNQVLSTSQPRMSARPPTKQRLSAPAYCEAREVQFNLRGAPLFRTAVYNTYAPHGFDHLPVCPSGLVAALRPALERCSLPPQGHQCCKGGEVAPHRIGVVRGGCAVFNTHAHTCDSVNLCLQI
jgi:hypothetical protein